MKSVYKDKSKISGYGLFIKEGAKRGERICYIKGDKRHKINRSLNDSLANPDWVGIKKHWWIDPIPPFKFLNHSCNPNAGIKGTVTLFALRNIKPGEEITVDYSTFEGDEQWQLEGGKKCMCGETNCRGVIKSIHYLPRQVYKKYLPFISTHFKREYERNAL